MHSRIADPKAALSLLTRFAQSLLAKNTLDDLLWDIAQNVGDLLGFEDCVVYLHEPHGLVQAAAYGKKSPHERAIFNRLVLKHGQGIVGAVAQSRTPLRIDDTSKDPRYVSDVEASGSELAVPILYGDATLGVLDSEAARTAAFTEADEAMFVAIATLAAPRIASALAERDRERALTALRQHESEREEREQILREERLEALGKLAGGIAHDFNNLLTAILGNISLARMDLPQGEPLELLAEAESACMRARSLTKQLLTFSQGGEPVRQPGNLGQVARDAVEFALRGSQLQAHFAIDADLPTSEFDPGQLAHVFHSLAINAVQACQGRGALSVRVRSERSPAPGSVVVEVEDDGPGIPDEVQTKVFDPFFTTRPGGTGMGLATSFWILRRHGGSLELAQRPRAGARFVLRLPAIESSQPAHAAEPRQDAFHGRRVLVLDDEPSMRKLLLVMLARLQCEAVAVDTSEQCLSACRDARAAGAPFHVALLDLTMPGDLPGHETLRLLQQADPDLQAVVTSGYHDDPVLSRHRDYGFAARLEKPFNLPYLQAALRQALMERGLC